MPLAFCTGVTRENIEPETRNVKDGKWLDEDRRSAMRSPSLPNRTGGSPASGFPVGRPRWTGASHLPIASDRALARRFFAAPTRSALWHYVGPRVIALAS